ncbi:MAG: hypothetical protein JWO64_413 [Hyphomicrobiales bacterium]|jgi:hypothetical protein|nr:hypothetical protein [Hyphomicrobiales bacterium]
MLTNAGQTMKRFVPTLAGLFTAMIALPLLTGAPQAADLQPTRVAEIEPGWTFRVTPYGWLTAMKGTQTVRGRTVDVDASFIDIVEKSDTLVGLMADFEARYGRWALIGDAVWTKVGLGGDTTQTRPPSSGVVGTVGASLGLDFQMAIIEFGAAYEVARSGALAFDVLAGGRYWHQKANLSVDLAATVDLGALEIAGSRAIAKSGSVDWVDPMVGGRLRYEIAPGQQFTLRGDIGGFGVGSRFSWQAIAAYGYDFAVHKGVTYSGVIGYRALYVDYSKGSGSSRYAFDILQHGPVVGLSIRF